MSTNNESYNGWSNYETWAVNVHIGDTLQDWAIELAKSYDVHRYNSSKLGNYLFDLSHYLRDTFTELVVEPTSVIESDLLSDLLLRGIDRINWWELANHCDDAIEYINAQSQQTDIWKASR